MEIAKVGKSYLDQKWGKSHQDGSWDKKSANPEPAQPRTAGEGGSANEQPEFLFLVRHRGSH
jgi:hypothetical protein